MGLFASIANAFTRPRVVVGGGVVATLPLWQQFSRIGGNLTPADVSAILRNADAGDTSGLVELANESRQKDGTLHSVLRKRESALSALPLQVEAYTEPGADDPLPRDEDAAAFVREALDDIVGDGQETIGVPELIAHMQGAILHGFAVAETRWRKRGADVVPEAFVPVDGRRFYFRQSDGRLVFAPSNVRSVHTDGIDLMAAFPGQFIQHQPRENGDVPAREGLGRMLVWCALFRNWAVADWMKLAELSWKPWRLGKLKRGAVKRDRENLREILEYLTTNGVGILNEDVASVDILVPQGNSAIRSNHKELCDFMGAEMAKGVLGETLTTEQGDRGSQSLGNVHNEVRLDLRAYDGQQCAASIRRCIFAPLVWFKFGPTCPVPRCRISGEEAVDIEAIGRGLKAMRDVGLKVPEAWAYDVTGIPLPSPDEAVLGEDDAVEVDLTELDQQPPAPPMPPQPPGAAPGAMPPQPDAEEPTT